MVTQDCLEWLEFAEKDIYSAQKLYSVNEKPRLRPLEYIAFHCQQSAEKALKAYIVHHEGVMPDGDINKKYKHHNLNPLRQACAKYSSRFNSVLITKYCNILDPYGVIAKYPKNNLSLDSADVLRCINAAKRLFDFVRAELGLKKKYF